MVAGAGAGSATGGDTLLFGERRKEPGDARGPYAVVEAGKGFDESWFGTDLGLQAGDGYVSLHLLPLPLGGKGEARDEREAAAFVFRGEEEDSAFDGGVLDSAM